MSVEVIIARIEISFDYSDWKPLRSVFIKCANRFGLPPALGELLECRCRTNDFPKLKNHELILKWKRDILGNDSRNISWHGGGFLWVLGKEIFFPLESWKNICESPQMSVVKYEEWMGRWKGDSGMCVSSFFFPFSFF